MLDLPVTTCMENWLFTRQSQVMSLIVSYFVLSFPHDMSWMRAGIQLSQVLRISLPTNILVY